MDQKGWDFYRAIGRSFFQINNLTLRMSKLKKWDQRVLKGGYVQDKPRSHVFRHPPPRSLGKSIRHGERLKKSRQDKALDRKHLTNYCLPVTGLLSENFTENANWGSRRGSSGFLHPPPRLKDKYYGTNQRLEIFYGRASTDYEDQCPAIAGC